MNLQGVTTGTWVRTILLALALLNQVLMTMGMSPLPIDDEQLEQTISTGATLVTALWAWWRNQSFSSAAQAGDEVMNRQKAQGL